MKKNQVAPEKYESNEIQLIQSRGKLSKTQDKQIQKKRISSQTQRNIDQNFFNAIDLLKQNKLNKIFDGVEYDHDKYVEILKNQGDYLRKKSKLVQDYQLEKTNQLIQKESSFLIQSLYKIFDRRTKYFYIKFSTLLILWPIIITTIFIEEILLYVILFLLKHLYLGMDILYDEMLRILVQLWATLFPNHMKQYIKDHQDENPINS